MKMRTKRFIHLFSVYLFLGIVGSGALKNQEKIQKHPDLHSEFDNQTWNNLTASHPEIERIWEKMQDRYLNGLAAALQRKEIAISLSGWVVLNKKNIAPDRLNAVQLLAEQENKDKKRLYQILSSQNDATTTELGTLAQQFLAEKWLEAAAANGWLIHVSRNNIRNAQKMR